MVIQAAKPKFVAESRTRVYFEQHVKLPRLPTLCFVATKLVTNVVIRAECASTCNATMLRDKLKNVARITGRNFAKMS